ncbi:MAG: hypothetical protein RLZ47_1435 [Bacteroidota bacterium]|jgi:1,4-alpha-glucan branching enzyme
MKKSLIFLQCLLLLVAVSCKKSPNGTDDGQTPPPPVNLTETGLITVNPSFPSDNQPVTITFDASKGNGALSGFSGDVYMHIGVITDLSTSPTNWKYVKFESFNLPSSTVKMTAIGGNKYQFTLSPRSFFGVPNNEKILQIAVVFRNADGSIVGRNADGSDIYTPIYESNTLQVKFTSPESEPTFSPKPVINVQSVGGQLQIRAVSSRAANLTLSLNDQSFATASAATSITGTANITANGVQRIKVTATEGGNTAEQSLQFIIQGTPVIEALPAAATKDGVNIINNGSTAIFNLTAPNKSSVYLIGDFNNWQLSNAFAMKRTPDGNRWWIQIDNLNPQTEYAYQYLIDGQLRLADPYTEKVLDPNNDRFILPSIYPNLKAYPTGKTTGIVSVFQPVMSSYNWQVSNFNRPKKTDLVIYELHIRDFVTERSYAATLAKLPYLKQLGINAIELMPVNEFEGNSSWGYNPSFYFAADKYYGTKQALQNFIDECHKQGIAVILDLVLNHSFGQAPMVQMYFNSAANTPAANNPWFNTRDMHPFSVGYDFNHLSPHTKYFAKNVMKFWMQEYKVDGFRFDLSKGFTQNLTTDVGVWGRKDDQRIAIWREYNDFMKAIDPNFYVILEHFADDDEEKILAEQGMMLWNNLNHAYSEAAKGFTANFNRALSGTHGFTSAHQDKLITYMESHDEERMMYRMLQSGNVLGSYNIKQLNTALKRKEMAAAFLFAIPGPKMLWQFGELGYEVNIDFNGRTGEKPVRWNYTEVAERKALYDAIAKMIKLKVSNAAFETTNFSTSFSGMVKHVILNSSGVDVVVVGNFDVTANAANITFPSTGIWYDFMNPGQTHNVSGNYTKTLQPGEYHIYTSIDLNQ